MSVRGGRQVVARRSRRASHALGKRPVFLFPINTSTKRLVRVVGTVVLGLGGGFDRIGVHQVLALAQRVVVGSGGGRGPTSKGSSSAMGELWQALTRVSGEFVLDGPDRAVERRAEAG
jgi:hypothetical protein